MTNRCENILTFNVNKNSLHQCIVNISKSVEIHNTYIYRIAYDALPTVSKSGNDTDYSRSRDVYEI